MQSANMEWLKGHANHTGEGDVGWRCKKTNTLIEAILTDRTIWDDDGPGPCASSEGVRSVVQAYCPKCTGAPEITPGSPIMRSALIEV